MRVKHNKSESTMAGAGSVVRGEGEEATMKISWAFEGLVLLRQPVRR